MRSNCTATQRRGYNDLTSYLFREIAQRFVNACAVLLLCDVTTCVAHGSLYFRDCVRRTGWHRCNFSIQHGDIIVMIAGREDFIARDTDQACQLSKGRALVVVGVAKTEIDAVSLIIKFWMASPHLLNELRNLLHFFLAFRSKTFEAIGIVNETGLRFLCHKIDYLGEHGLRCREQLNVIPGAAIVPIAERLPFVAVSAGTKDVALGCQNEIRTDWDFEICKPGFEQIDRASSVDCPARTCILQLTNQFHALPIQCRFANVRDERSVKIDTE